MVLSAPSSEHRQHKSGKHLIHAGDLSQLIHSVATRTPVRGVGRHFFPQITDNAMVAS